MWVDEIRQNRRAFGSNIVSIETRAEHERLWGSDITRRRTIELVRRVHSPHSRRMNRAVPLHCEQISDGELADYCSRVHAAIRQLRKRNRGLVARRVSVGNNGKQRSSEIVLRQMETKTALSQLRSLQCVLQSGSAYKIEKVYFGLSPETWDYLEIGFKDACSNRKLRGFTHVDEPSGHLLSRPMLNANLLNLILPHAIAAAPKRGRPSVSARDRAVAELLRIFKELTRRRNSAAKRGGFDGPMGDGANFLRVLERIFRIDLVPGGSTHAIDRAESY